LKQHGSLKTAVRTFFTGISRKDECVRLHDRVEDLEENSVIRQFISASIKSTIKTCARI